MLVESSAAWLPFTANSAVSFNPVPIRAVLYYSIKKNFKGFNGSNLIKTSTKCWLNYTTVTIARSHSYNIMFNKK